ncbi:membrane alanyl aminopeptidase-like [Battus philenor]|uniref:membrane alanyl aminopeptidase-like n=1 Tax=Battus philenor TaxID=42288 RepID=UPI0035CF3EBD
MGVLHIFLYISFIATITCLPINIKTVQAPDAINEGNVNISQLNSKEIITDPDLDLLRNAERNARNQVRPGMSVTSYEVELEINGNGFNGRLLARVVIEDHDTVEDDIIFQIDDLTITSVEYSLAGSSNFQTADFNENNGDGILTISPAFQATLYSFVITYEGSLDELGRGLYLGNYDNDNTYLAMNLHPTFARRVFPCVDEPTESSNIRFTINNVQYDNIVMNSMLEENSATQFRPLQGPPHLWGMVAHNLNNAYFPTPNVVLNGRSGVMNQDAQASIAINHYFNALNEWTSKPYVEIVVNQNGRLNIIAVPDIDRDWYALSTVSIWEPYVFMDLVHSVKQRQVGLTKMAEAISRQWFGYVIHPENWRHQWIISGLSTYVAYEILKDFQDGPQDTNYALLDGNTLFLTEVIQESLLRDAYVNSQPIEPAQNIFDAVDIRYHMNSVMKYKAPALLRMLRLALGDNDNDFIQHGARTLLNNRFLETVNTFNFYDAINSAWLFDGNDVIDNIPDFFNPWLQTTGYPLVHVGLRRGGVLITQERFAFSAVQQQRNYIIPLTYTTSVEPNFDDDNVYPTMVIDGTETLDMEIGDDDWIIFNIQGQGYYRVSYDLDLWDRIIEALEDPERREEIHPLNRAALIDDALNLARASKLGYDVALRLVLTMEHETEYAVWKAFVRNMDFLRKHLMALVDDNDDYEEDIYERMIGRTIVAFEEEIGFIPDDGSEPAMNSLMRGLVMDHACRANYEPCVAAAVDLFYDPDDNELVNPDIPRDIRPAVYCTMVREGDEDVITALYDRLEVETSLYERLVILESLACSQDADFINSFLAETIAANGPHSTEENVKIFKAVAGSGHENARLALNFIALRTNEIRNQYGGPDKLEEVILTLAENMVTPDLVTDFINWVGSRNNNLEDSEDYAEATAKLASEIGDWETMHLESVYEWIEENDATSLFVSAFLITLSVIITLINN